MAVVPEMERRASTSSPNGSRTSLPYPSFSKEHSKEAVHSREDMIDPKNSLLTPDPTDLSQENPTKKPHQAERALSPARGVAPPSPPLTATAVDPELKRAGSGNSMRRDAQAAQLGVGDGRRGSIDSGSRITPGPRFSASKSSLRQTAIGEGTQLTSNTEISQPSTIRKDNTPNADALKARPISPNTRPPGRTASAGSHHISVVTQSTDSDATSIAPDQKYSHRPPVALSNSGSSPNSVVDSSPRTPTPRDAHFPSVEPEFKEPPMVEVFDEPPSRPYSVDPVYSDSPLTPPPPPPPPAMTDAPRVDYLLQNGGLSHPIPRSLLTAVTNQGPGPAYQQYSSPRFPASQNTDVATIFAPLQTLLDDYTQVMSKHGSIAVATGYRSVARRLLDRLEAVFARNISSESCNCIMCHGNTQFSQPTEEESGVSWGEILEFVSGRRELPQWPPFSISKTAGLGILDMEHPAAPMQKLDIDVPEEYRDHYVRQGKKTKQAVQKWLASQPEEATSPPQEVDDETLTFAILTHLEPEKRQLFTAILRGMSTLPGSRAQTPMEKFKNDILAKTSLALQRLYRLSSLPRDPESTIFLLKNPDLHGVLATLAAVSSGEWEILVSGRFDGFLWSGAESVLPSSFTGSTISRGPSRNTSGTPLSRTTTPFSMGGGPSRGPSRGPTPFNGTRGMTPAPSSFGAPVQMDEETEIAVLAEVEREIYLGMEALEDAFESLHCKAEAVRRSLRERSAGLSMAAQARRGSTAEGIEVRLGTPASTVNGWSGLGWDSETDDGIDERSELAPDDSASNISFHRRRRPDRRTERRTPAPVEEEDESSVTPEATKKKW
ncbi:hypothetical protein AOQ84DRAFT_321111 [Glonium stellatum]|uniref:Uncharacterized protein n=1 Tax=Glonium stellatum TaxID=574774 RepID=A0A8E2JRQ1_9PEZI|nr:hypothetical protein AOQ84DRAFT_321111 [Glonium stellatum]